MSLNNINNPGASPGIDSLTQSPSATGGNDGSVGLNENFDWFSVSDGKALPISAQSQFGDTSTMDEMVSAMLGHLGLGHTQAT